MNHTSQNKLHLDDIITGIAECVSVSIGAVDGETLSILESDGYDQAPVTAFDTGPVVGLIETSRLRELFNTSSPLCSDDAAISAQSVSSVVTVDELLLKIEQNRAVLVVDALGDVLGIITVSDLNSHRFRAALYPYLASLESGLADAIEREFSDPWEWLVKIGDGRINVVGHWEILKRSGMEIGATSGATLTQLLQVVEEHAPLRSVVGFDSKKKAQKFRRRVGAVRNAVMHPARPLIDDELQVEGLREVISMVVQARDLLHASASDKR